MLVVYSREREREIVLTRIQGYCWRLVTSNGDAILKRKEEQVSNVSRAISYARVHLSRRGVRLTQLGKDDEDDEDDDQKDHL